MYIFPSKSTYLCELTFTMQQTISQLTYLKHSLALMIWWISLEVVLTQLKMGGLEWAYSHVWAPSGMSVMLRVSRKRGKPKCTSLFQAPTCVGYDIISLASKSCGQTQSQYRGDRPLKKTTKKDYMPSSEKWVYLGDGNNGGWTRIFLLPYILTYCFFCCCLRWPYITFANYIILKSKQKKTFFGS